MDWGYHHCFDSIYLSLIRILLSQHWGCQNNKHKQQHTAEWQSLVALYCPCPTFYQSQPRIVILAEIYIFLVLVSGPTLLLVLLSRISTLVNHHHLEKWRTCELQCNYQGSNASKQSSGKRCGILSIYCSDYHWCGILLILITTFTWHLPPPKAIQMVIQQQGQEQS